MSDKKTFCCVILDQDGKRAARAENKAAHLAALPEKVAAGIVVNGGALMKEHPAEGEIPHIIGSHIVMRGKDKEEIREILRNDVYSKAGVWDVDDESRVFIYPYLPS